MADEVYDRLCYPELPPKTKPPERVAAPSILRKATREDAVVVIQSFSKAWCMTGWRVGWMVSRKDLAARATVLNEFVVSHAPSFAQRAGETALLWGEMAVREMLMRLRENRDLCSPRFRRCPG